MPACSAVLRAGSAQHNGKRGQVCLMETDFAGVPYEIQMSKRRADGDVLQRMRFPVWVHAAAALWCLPRAPCPICAPA